jgi:hypothetical protein
LVELVDGLGCHMVMQNRLILVYGPSGTGKTSLVQCGLANRFDKTDWFPLFLRRQNDLNQSLQQALSAVTGGTFANGPDGLAHALEDLYETWLRPAYLIFDQFEELFILGSEKEQQQFVQSIQQVLSRPVPCRLLLIIREEYLAHLYHFERAIPTLFDRRLRVEPMGASKVTQVLSGSFSQYNIQVAKPEDALFQQIIANVSGGKAGIQLPYLQVYLDLLYREDFARTYPERTDTKDDTGWLPLELTPSEVQQLGKIDNVLEKFLLEQETSIQKRLEKAHPGIPADTVRRVLDAFVSEEGTKRPVAYKRKDGQIELDARWAALLQPMHTEVFTACCHLLEQSRLLRFSDNYIELAHDALAALIDQRRSTQERRLQETYTRLLHQYREFQETGAYLNRRQLTQVEDLQTLLEPRLDDPLRRFIADSATWLTNTEQAALLAERKKRRQAMVIAVAGFVLAAIALVAALVAWQARRAMAQKAYEAQRKTAIALKVEGRYKEALHELNVLEEFARDLPQPSGAEAQQLRRDWSAIARYMHEADSLVRWVRSNEKQIGAAAALPAALGACQQALKISSDAYLQQRNDQLEKDMQVTFARYVLLGKTMLASNQPVLAREYFQTALLLRPDDPEVQRLLKNK